jgi:Flp pilus assembly protein TadG
MKLLYNRHKVINVPRPARDLMRASGQRRRRPGERGQAMIEAAFVIIVLVVLLFLGFHFVPLFLRLESVVDAARQGARVAAVQGSMAQGCAAAISYSQQKLTDVGILHDSHITITTTPAGTYTRGGIITVVVHATIPLLWGATSQFESSASEEIQPGRSHWPLPAGVSLSGLCDVTA